MSKATTCQHPEPHSGQAIIASRASGWVKGMIREGGKKERKTQVLLARETLLGIQNVKQFSIVWRGWSWLCVHPFIASTWPGYDPPFTSSVATDNVDRHARGVARQSSHSSFSRPNPNGSTSLEATLLAAHHHSLPSIIRMESELALECMGRAERAQQHGSSNHMSWP